MKKEDAIFGFYSKQFKKHGANDVRSLGWGSRDTQFRRFEILTEIGIKDGNDVIDMGCGFGDFKTFMDNRGRRFEYHPVDINKTFLEIARLNHPKIYFQYGDINTLCYTHDWIIASGIFSLDYDNWEKDTFKILKVMIEKVKMGVAVNFLSSLTQRKGLKANRFVHPQWVINNLIIKLTRKFVLRHDYLDNDFTVYMYK
jgi:SAM-dependent methyltransferase